jgi:hypothetical protein
VKVRSFVVLELVLSLVGAVLLSLLPADSQVELADVLAAGRGGVAALAARQRRRLTSVRQRAGVWAGPVQHLHAVSAR